jgi:alpha-beta hydrolase superfamily lysophospholipase
LAKSITSLYKEDHILPSCDGESSLFVRHFSRGIPRIHFLIVHGALEHSGRHMDLVNFWLKSYTDVAVTVFDGLGHGRSGGARCYLSEFKIYVDDMLKIGEFVQSKNVEESRTFICAHSLGGLITLTRILDSAYGWPFRTQGVILSSPCIRPRIVLSGASEALLARLDIIAPKLHLPAVYKGADLTRDPNRANDFDTDPLIPKYITVRMAKEIIEASSRVRDLSYYLKIPTLFLVAGIDRIVDQESTLLFAQGVDKRLVKVIKYPQHYHELWNEIDRQEIFVTMKKWVESELKERG